MNEREQMELKLNEKGLDYEEYFYNCTHAARLYILHEPDSTIPTAKRHMTVYVMVYYELFTFSFNFILKTPLLREENHAKLFATLTKIKKYNLN